MPHINSNLIIIFAFIIAMGAINQYFRWKRAQQWHETARRALEKGQPLPKDEWDWRSNRGWNHGRPWSASCDVRRGLVLIAVGTALYIALPGENNLWAAIPAFVGVAFLIFGLFSVLRSDKPSDPQDRDPSPKQ